MDLEVKRKEVTGLRNNEIYLRGKLFFMKENKFGGIREVGGSGL